MNVDTKSEREVIGSMLVDTSENSDSIQTSNDQSQVIESPVTTRGGGENQKEVLLRDTWRVNSRFIGKEEESHTNFIHTKDTPSTPSYAGLFRLLHHHTRPKDIVTGKRISPVVRQSQSTRTRVLLDYPYREISRFSKTFELVNAMKDALEAHSVAFGKSGTTHGNIGVQTILIGSKGEGYLINWDLSQMHRPYDYISAQFGIAMRRILLSGAAPDSAEEDALDFFEEDEDDVISVEAREDPAEEG